METKKDLLSDVNYQENFGYTLATPMSRLGGSILQSLIFFLPVFLIFGWKDYVQRAGLPGNNITLAQIGFTTVLGAVFYPLWSGTSGISYLV